MFNPVFANCHDRDYIAICDISVNAKSDNYGGRGLPTRLDLAQDQGMSIMNWRHRFSKALKIAKDRDGLTQERLAEILQVRQSTISGYKSGRRTPNLEDFPRIASALGVSVGWLLLGRVSETPEEVRLVREYRQLPEDKKAILFGIMGGLLHPVDPTPPTEEEDDILFKLGQPSSKTDTNNKA